MRAAIALALIAASGALVVGPIAYGDDSIPVSTSNITPDFEIPADGGGNVTRGTTVQVTDTLPPPTTVAGDSFDVPAGSGDGRRIVYSKTIQRIWMIEDDGSVYNTHRVSGRMDQPDPGTYSVFSRSTFTCSNMHSNICMRWMVRFAHSRRGDNIGFHEIPKRDGVPMQTDSQIGQPLSGGCVRQLTNDAIITWDWAQLGTVVVVLA